MLVGLRIVPRSLAEVPWSPDIVIHDIRKRLPFPDGSMDVVFSSHTLEHVYRNEALDLLRECRRVLKPHGVCRVVVPDLRAIIQEYQGRSPFEHAPAEWECPGDRLVSRLLMRSPQSRRGSRLVRLATALDDFQSHKWMYDAESLGALLSQAGFEAIETMQYLQTRAPCDLDEVESAGRVLHGQGVIVEGLAPG